MSLELGGQVVTEFIMGRCVKKNNGRCCPYVSLSLFAHVKLSSEMGLSNIGRDIHRQQRKKKKKTERPQHSASEHRIVVYNHSPRPEHHCICHFKVESAQQCKLTFFQSSSNVIILYENTSACSLEKSNYIPQLNLVQTNGNLVQTNGTTTHRERCGKHHAKKRSIPKNEMSPNNAKSMKPS